MSELPFCVGSVNRERVCIILEKMAKELNQQDLGWLFLFRDSCLEFLILCFRSTIEGYSAHHLELNNRNIAVEVTKYMHKNYSCNISPEDVAEAMYISTRHLQRVMKAFFNSTFSEMLSQFRLNYAKEYLINTNYSLDRIAELCGLSSAQTLYRLFEKYEDSSICKFREEARIPRHEDIPDKPLNNQ